MHDIEHATNGINLHFDILTPVTDRIDEHFSDITFMMQAISCRAMGREDLIVITDESDIQVLRIPKHFDLCRVK